LTEKLYWKDAYMKDFTAHVISKTDQAIVLDRTAFFPEGGGQAADTGLLNNVKVIDVRKQDEDIVHFVEKISDFAVGNEVTGTIDWDRRYKIMRLHTAAHVVFFCFREVFDQNATASSGRVSEEKERSDYVFTKELNPEDLKNVENRANEVISKDLNVQIWFEDTEARQVNPWTGAVVPITSGLRRKWRIEGFPVMECGGTHVRNTSEIGNITLKKAKNPGAGRRRIEIRLIT
jgi:Ser-tRNA(Ala) deacylase AlaX